MTTRSRSGVFFAVFVGLVSLSGLVLKIAGPTAMWLLIGAAVSLLVATVTLPEMRKIRRRRE